MIRLRQNGMRAAAPLSRPRASRVNELTHLSEKMKMGLLTLLAEGTVTHDLRHWRGGKGGEIRRETIEALFDRNLVVIAYETKPRRRTLARLTEIGRLAAEGLAAEAQNEHRAAGLIGEQAMALIGAIIDDFESSPNVYPEEQEAEEIVE